MFRSLRFSVICSVLGLFLAFCISGFAEEIPYPGKVIDLGPSLSSFIFSGDGFSGAAADVQISVFGPAVPGLFRFGGGYGFAGDGSRAVLEPRINGGWGYRFVRGKLLLTPFLGAELILPIIDGNVGVPVPAAVVEAAAGFRVRGGRFAELFARGSYVYGGFQGSGLSGGIGLRLSSSSPVMLPVLKPKGGLSIDPETLFSPDGDGINDELAISYRIRHQGNAVDAVLRIVDQYGQPFRTWEHVPGNAGTIVWGGYSDVEGAETESVSSASDYTIELEITDILGRKTTSSLTFRVDVLVVKEGDAYKIRVPSIQFPPNSADLTLLTDQSAIDHNNEIISRLAVIFTKFPDYRITIAGHANADFYNDPQKMEEEQRDVLLPLSLSRAETVRDMLVKAGVRPEIIQVAGYGAAFPLVPFSDETQRWKNRRVEFILEK